MRPLAPPMALTLILARATRAAPVKPPCPPNGTLPEGGNGTRLAATTSGPGMGGKQGPGGKRGEQF
jgi:hypothetical protein